jgi:uncharacterized membrane protein
LKGETVLFSCFFLDATSIQPIQVQVQEEEEEDDEGKDALTQYGGLVEVTPVPVE